MTTPTKLTKYETLTRILLGDYPEPGQPFGVVWRDGAIGTAQDIRDLVAMGLVSEPSGTGTRPCFLPTDRSRECVTRAIIESGVNILPPRQQGKALPEALQDLARAMIDARTDREPGTSPGASQAPSRGYDPTQTLRTLADGVMSQAERILPARPTPSQMDAAHREAREDVQATPGGAIPPGVGLRVVRFFAFLPGPDGTWRDTVVSLTAGTPVEISWTTTVDGMSKTQETYRWEIEGDEVVLRNHGQTLDEDGLNVFDYSSRCSIADLAGGPDILDEAPKAFRYPAWATR